MNRKKQLNISSDLTFMVLFVTVTAPIIAFFSYYFNLPFIEGKGAAPAVASDAIHYYNFVNKYNNLEIFKFSSPETFGLKFPAHLYMLLDYNLINVLLCNVVLYYFIIYKFLKKTDNKLIFVLLHMSFLYLFGSFTPPNKEIGTVLSLLYFSYFIMFGGSWYLVLSLAISFTARLECMVFIGMASIYFKMFEYIDFKLRKPLHISAILSMVLVLSIVFGQYKATRRMEFEGAALISPLGGYTAVTELSYRGFLFFTFPFHMLWNLLGNLPHPQQTLRSLNNTLMYFSQFMHLILFIGCTIYRKVRITEIGVLFFFYVLAFSLSPTVIHRYVLPGYILLILIFCFDEDNLNGFSKFKIHKYK
ncbi:MAG: hypothetical protein AB8G05_20790 [Oligoflexales bacterium]